MSQSILDPEDLATMEYVATHVFCPLQLPNAQDHTVSNDHSIAAAVASAAHLFSNRVAQADVPEWRRILRMLDNLQATVHFEILDDSCSVSQLTNMKAGDVVAFLIRAQNAAVVFRKQKDVTVFESFEVSPKAENVMVTQGKLLCSYPGPAVEVPNLLFDDEAFISELANFLVRMNDEVVSDAAATSHKAQSTVVETRDTNHPRYITELLTGIFRSAGRPANVVRMTKRIGDDVTWNNSELPWRRSSLWLLIRVVLQTTLDRTSLGKETYKAFMLFFMCRLANEKTCANLPNDVLHLISTKISRRLRKLDPSVPDWLSSTVLKTCASLRSILETRWRQVQTCQRLSPVWAPSQLDLIHDIQLSLSTSGCYLRNSLDNRSFDVVPAPFNPQHQLRGTLVDFLSSDGVFFDKAYRAEPHVTLYDVERAVEEGVDEWLDHVLNNDRACVSLVALADKYSSSALKVYGGNPELLSVMLLTTIELWVALDKIAILETPMLADYSPEIPTSLLRDLLLSKTSNLHRVRHVHKYLSLRHSQSQWSAFSPAITINSFAVRFFRNSSRLQCLKARIEEDAQREVQKKITELKKANADHAELKRRVSKAEHEFGINRRGYSYHDKYCHKCALERELKNMQITVHEWPLPDNQLGAEVVVFELDCPVSFNMWRAATFHLVVDLCSSSLESRHPYIKLSDYAALQPYLVQHSRSRITLASDTKPFVVTHYSQQPIPSTKERVCVKNGLKFYGYDSLACIAASNSMLDHVDIGRHCTYTLANGPYKNLQKYVNSTAHSSNVVIANQVDCHSDLLVHEYIAFGHLRSGGLLQWLNTLREIRGRSLSFRRHEVHFLLAQTVSQVGPFTHLEWTWHYEIQQPSFCNALIVELGSLVHDVEANWLEAVTMDTISFLLRRLLASSPDHNVSLKAAELLRTVRCKVFCWVRELSAKLTRKSDDEELRGFLRDTAAICRGTFDVGPAMIRCLLHSAEDIRVLISCAILIHDHTPSKVSCLTAYSKLLLDRDRRLSLALENVLSDVLQADSNDDGINLAVRDLWSAYRSGSKWTPLQGPNSRWFSCKTAPTTKQAAQEVHLNLLDGSLLINGKPLGRLPNEILRHPVYNLLFGAQVLDIIPSDIQGMDYSTRASVSGHQVYFALKGTDLVIKAKRIATNDPEIIELIPQAKLSGDLPAVLIDGHVHWLNLCTSVMEIRPLNALWETSLENWKICCIPGQYRMQKGREFLVDIRSPSWDMVSTLLAPFDIPQHLIVIVSSVDASRPSSLQLSVALPRYGLSFYLDEDGDFQSHNMRGMVYDKNQSIGALFGLANCLVLRPKLRNDHAVELVSRCVLIPDGIVSFKKDGHHVHVNINTHGSALERVTYQAYRVDTDLGCLRGNVSVTSKLYCAYLHALTSGCGTDPLTGRSGTEEALSLLRSAGCWSIIKFSPRDAELLGLIASLCPLRTWYPKHRKCMQTVKWLDLPVNSQHHELYEVCKEIKEHYEKVQLFHETQSGPLFQTFPSRDDQLLERSARRAACLFPPESPGRSDRDTWYSARDLVKKGSGEHRAYTAASAVYHRTAHATSTKNILSMVESWTSNIPGDAPLSLRYDQSWLSPKFPLIWLKAYNLLRGSNEGKWFQLLFSLSAMAYASPELSDLVPVFVAFALSPQFHWEDPPSYDSYDISNGYKPSPATLREYVSSCAHSFDRSPESSELSRHNESFLDLLRRQRGLYDDRLSSDADTTVSRFLDAWPCASPPSCILSTKLYDVAELMSDARTYFASCYHNLKLKEHLIRVQNILGNVCSEAVPAPNQQYSFHPSQTSVPSHTSWLLTLDQLFARPAPSLCTLARLPRFQRPPEHENTPLAGPMPLHQLITTAKANTRNLFQHKYVSALCGSTECFEQETSVALGAMEPPTTGALISHYTQCRDNFTGGLNSLKQWLSARSQSEQALEQSSLWPRITAPALFRTLASNSPIALSEDWKRCITSLTLVALELQRARRLLRLHMDNLNEELQRELQNEGCDGWIASTRPDWLLVQLQGNFLVRRVQAEVADEMISPQSGENTVMQLNMGEGKSSVIVPIVVATLADSNQLVRVIVPKALTVQMFQVLVDRLGELANRRVYFLPFSRSLKLDQKRAVALHELLSECMEKGGILVAQPEHVLSLRLLSVEKQLPGVEDTQLSQWLLKLQMWLHCHSRDILDESDEILHVRYQLVYTVGLQQHMEGFPERWTTTEQILHLVNKHASSLRKLFPREVEFERGPSGSFPHFRILHTNAGQRLISLIAQDVLDGRLPNFNFGQLGPGLKDAIRKFISSEDIPYTQFELIRGYSKQTALWGGLLHLRGLLATGILLFAFRERRWRVDYGLAPLRTMLAVPYRAKDVPAQRAEFGHPDVAILLTCLSYYYGGLTGKQLRLSFEILLKQDDPSLDYDLWIRDCPAVPAYLHTLNGVNMESPEQWNTHLFPLFSRNQATVNFYLSFIVFPKEAKEFPSKLACSGWDLAEKKQRLLTGFSGTNDGQYLLPLHITQRDPDHQRGTNAKVLSYLLQAENRHYMCTSHESDERRDAREFLQILTAQEPPIRVLLDVGAQILDLENCKLAEAWLEINPDASAAIYFDDNDELTVWTRDGRKQLLLSSPFTHQLDKCVIYLDDAHTRGTDIKFPSGFRAAVTLGPKVTKDRLAQGCMRMRKLGHGHSIMFFAPLEIDQRIRSAAKKGPLDAITTVDILHWTIQETFGEIQRWAPHWAQQGTNHADRYDTWARFCQSQLNATGLSDKWLQPEAKGLEELYAPHNASNIGSIVSPGIHQRCTELGILSLCNVGVDEEQEREVIHEVERERQVERPPKALPATHSIHKDTVNFVTTGVIPEKTSAFRPIFVTLDETKAATDEAHIWSRYILATTDFEKTIRSSGTSGEYLRPVQWILSGKRHYNDALVILSPHEANHLMPSIRSSQNVHLHLYTPRVTKSMEPCDDLDLYSIPSTPTGWRPPLPLMDQLNVFAGQLYLKDYDAYIRLCRFLCVYARDLEDDQSIEAQHNGFIPPWNRPGHLRSVYTFQKSPLEPLRVLTGLRRKGMRFAPTHMGKLLDGRLLSEEDFDD